MNPQVHFMPVIPAAGLLSQSQNRFFVRSSGLPLCPLNSPAKAGGQAGLNKFGGDWLYAEDEYFPFDADSFEER